MNYLYMPIGIGIRSNTQGKLYKNEKEYLKNMIELDLQADKVNSEKYAKKRGRPKKLKDKPIQCKIGEFILNFD